MKMFKLLAVAALATSATVAMAADETVVTENGVATFSTFKPASVRAEVGTTGYGGAIGWSVNPTTGVVLGYNGGSIKWTDNLSVNGNDYDLDMDNKTAYLNAQIRPFSNWFYMAAGVGYLDNDYKISRTVGGSTATNFTVNGTDFQTAAGSTVKINGHMKYNSFAPYLGLGFSPDITSRFGVFGEVGAFYTGNPDVTLTSTGVATNNNGKLLVNEVAQEQQKISNDNKYKYLPVAKVGLTARF